MSWTKLMRLSMVIIIIINTGIIFATYMLEILLLPDEPISKAVLLSSTIILTITAPILFFLIFNKGKVVAFNLAFIAIFLIIMEVLFFFRIIQHPSFQTWARVTKNINSVEFLEHLPYVKFKPNVIVKSQGKRGIDFTYEWLTDELGVKNTTHQTFLDTHFDFIALGDSFTEAMGVKVDDTWTSKIAKKSKYKIYNAGVQGYSASQMKATYEELKNKLSHDGIIIGALPTIFSREMVFTEKDQTRKPLLLKVYHLFNQQGSFGVGGIRSIAVTRSKANSFLVQFLRSTAKMLKDNKTKTTGMLKDNNIENLNAKDHLSKYKSEIPSSYPTTQYLTDNQNWNLYTKNIIELSKIATEIGKKVILIQYPHRREIYFNSKQLGINNISEMNYYLELELLRKTLPKEIIILDMYPYIKKDWDENNEYLYFEKDGHMNERGQELIADFLIPNLN